MDFVAKITLRGLFLVNKTLVAMVTNVVAMVTIMVAMETKVVAMVRRPPSCQVPLSLQLTEM